MTLTRRQLKERAEAAWTALADTRGRLVAVAALHQPMIQDEFDVVTCSTAQLRDMLNACCSDGWNIIQITHLAGQDWVIISSTTRRQSAMQPTHEGSVS